MQMSICYYLAFNQKGNASFNVNYKRAMYVDGSMSRFQTGDESNNLMRSIYQSMILLAFAVLTNVCLKLGGRI